MKHRSPYFFTRQIDLMSDQELTRPGRITYQFTPVPHAATDLLEAGKITDADHSLLTILLRFKQPGQDWAWASKATLAERAGKNERSIARSAARLVTAGLIAHRPVDSRDPDCQANRTGWIWRFLWIDSAPTCETNLSPQQTGGVTKMSPPPMTKMSPKIDGVNLDREERKKKVSQSVLGAPHTCANEPDGRTDLSILDESNAAKTARRFYPQAAEAVIQYLSTLIELAGGDEDAVAKAIEQSAKWHGVVNDPPRHIAGILKRYDRGKGEPFKLSGAKAAKPSRRMKYLNDAPDPPCWQPLPEPSWVTEAKARHVERPALDRRAELATSTP